ncbi:ProQ/FinO family protein [Rhizobium sp. 16-449-1b]|uniref:ProQ/FinO family protein n=1 Tax=Rhizobium sp. 16-449-1b TaxID=2819989 RepID=UPI001AD95447|nr:ProQ/FinO family protein [Rhizobium sp. 16-449-1b]MBO9196003.1 ProQ/FinO family protein [Rhizobium sp. 16-449-1b]
MNNEQTSKMKPWVTSQGPVPACANDLKKAAAINELLTEPAAILPQQETDPILPFEIGIFEQFSGRLQPGIARIRLRRAVAAYAAAKNYLLACAQPDAMRHDIAGRPTSPVSADDRMAAQLRVTEIRRQRKLQADMAGGTPGIDIGGTQQD